MGEGDEKVRDALALILGRDLSLQMLLAAPAPSAGRIVHGDGLGEWLNSDLASTSAGLAGAAFLATGRGLRSRRLVSMGLLGQLRWYSASRSVSHVSESPREYSEGVSTSTYPVVDVVVTEKDDFYEKYINTNSRKLKLSTYKI